MPDKLQTIRLLTIVWLMMLASQSQAYDRILLDDTAIAFVETYPGNEEENSIRLLEAEAISLVKYWNSAKHIGLCKYAPQLWIIVNESSGNIRKFRLNSNTIKENNDHCFSIDKSYSNLLLHKYK